MSVLLFNLRCKQVLNGKQPIKGSLRPHSDTVPSVFALQFCKVLTLPLSSKVKLCTLIASATGLLCVDCELKQKI